MDWPLTTASGDRDLSFVVLWAEAKCTGGRPQDASATILKRAQFVIMTVYPMGGAAGFARRFRLPVRNPEAYFVWRRKGSVAPAEQNAAAGSAGSAATRSSFPSPF